MDTRRTEFSPNVTEDISEYMETKLRMCACHNSQAGKGIYLDPGTLTATAFLFFKEAHSTPKSKLSGHAEAFHIHILRRAVASHYYGEPDSTFDVVRGASAQAFRHHSYDWTNLVNGAVRVGRYVFEEFAADAVITFSGHSAIFASLVMVKVLPRERLLGMPVYLAMARDIDPAGTPPPLPGFAVVRGREGRFEVLVPHALADADPERKKNIAIIDDAITTGEAIITLKHYLLDTLEYRRASIRVGCFVCHELTTSLPDGRPDVWEFITDTTAYRLPWGDPLWFPRPGQ